MLAIVCTYQQATNEKYMTKYTVYPKDSGGYGIVKTVNSKFKCLVFGVWPTRVSAVYHVNAVLGQQSPN